MKTRALMQCGQSGEALTEYNWYRYAITTEFARFAWESLLGCDGCIRTAFLVGVKVLATQEAEGGDGWAETESKCPDCGNSVTMKAARRPAATQTPPDTTVPPRQ